MLDGNTVRVDRSDGHDEFGAQAAQPSAPAGAPVQNSNNGNDKAARAIAEGLMVLPHDNGIPPLLRRRGDNQLAPLPQPPREQVQPDAAVQSAPVEPVPVQSVSLKQARDNDQTDQVVTPHPAVFRSQATPLAIKPDTRPNQIPASPVTPHLTAVKEVESAVPIAKTESDSAADTFDNDEHRGEQRERAPVQPPSLHAIRDHIPEAPAKPVAEPELDIPEQPMTPAGPVPQSAASAPTTAEAGQPREKSASPVFEQVNQASPRQENPPVQQPHFQQPQYQQPEPRPPQYQPPQREYMQQPQQACEQPPQQYYQPPPAYHQHPAGSGYAQPVPPAQDPSYGYGGQPQAPYAPPPQYNYGAAYQPAAQLPPMHGYAPPPQAPQYYPQQGHYPQQTAYAQPPAYAQTPAYEAQRHSAASPSSEVADAVQLMSGLLQYLPQAGQFWSEAERENWLDAAATLFDLAYGDLGHSDRRVNGYRDHGRRHSR